MNVDFTEKLIREVRNRPIIYLLSHPEYKNYTKTLQAWREIQRELNVEVAALKAKWKNLKDTYKKFKQSKESTSGPAAKKLSNWAWADQMSFIDSTVSDETQSSILFPKVEAEDDNPTTSNLSQRTHTQKDNEIGQEPGVKPETRSTIIQKRKKIKCPTVRSILYSENRKKNRNTDDDKVHATCDGIDLLFLGYADTFKKLSKRKQVSVKFEIAKIFMEAELGDLEDIRAPAATESYSRDPTTITTSERYSIITEAKIEYDPLQVSPEN